MKKIKEAVQAYKNSARYKNQVDFMEAVTEFLEEKFPEKTEAEEEVNETSDEE